MLLIGDSGYGQQPWLFAPIAAAEVHTQQEENYNRAHRKARNRVERCIGAIKSRFRCLSRMRGLMYDPKVSGHIINACVVLHNIMVEENYPMPDRLIIDVNDDDDIPDMRVNSGARIRLAGFQARARLVENHF